MGHISHLLTRPVGRPWHQPKGFYESFAYQAQTWAQPRRVVAKVEWHAGELFPRVGFIVTNLTGWSSKVVEFYDQWGTAEQQPGQISAVVGVTGGRNECSPRRISHSSL